MILREAINEAIFMNNISADKNVLDCIYEDRRHLHTEMAKSLVNYKIPSRSRNVCDARMVMKFLLLLLLLFLILQMDGWLFVRLG